MVGARSARCPPSQWEHNQNNNNNNNNNKKKGKKKEKKTNRSRCRGGSRPACFRQRQTGVQSNGPCPATASPAWVPSRPAVDCLIRSAWKGCWRWRRHRCCLPRPSPRCRSRRAEKPAMAPQRRPTDRRRSRFEGLACRRCETAPPPPGSGSPSPATGCCHRRSAPAADGGVHLY